MSRPTQIYIDDSGRVHVSYQCDSCSEWTHVEDYCGYGEDYLCPDCFVPAYSDEEHQHAMALDSHAVNQQYIHDWLIMLVDFDWTTDVRIAIHKDVATPKAFYNADCSSPDPEDDTSRFGPGTSAHTLHMDDMDGLHADVNTVYCLVDSGLIDATKAPNIFKGGE